MLDTELRRTVAWMIAVRAVIGTILLGSATFAQITAPGSFPVDPFFFLIGLTYALTISYALTLRLVDRHRIGEPDQEEKRRSEEHTSELQSQSNLVCRLLLEKKK